MTIRISNKLSSKGKFHIIPLKKDSKNATKLAALAKQYAISATLLKQNFQAEFKEIHSFYAGNATVILLGLGETPEYSNIVKAFTHLSAKWKDKFSKEINLLIDQSNISESDLSHAVKAATNGLVLGRYKLGLYKSNGHKKPDFLQATAGIHIVSSNNYKTEAVQGKALAETQLEIFDLVNAPGNKAKPETLAAWAKASGKKHNYKVTAMTKAQIKKTGLDALLAVNKGSEYPPSFIIMEYKPKKAPKGGLKKIGLVGKGVTFDTGGLSIKGSNNMHFMKSDMGGAAAVLGTMELVAKMKLPVHLIGIVPTTDNCVDALAVKPGDVINSYSGKTIEIIDTDAEGRLILADGLAYMVKHFKPDTMIDLATLTGSAVRALGYQAGALLSSNEKLVSKLRKAGDVTGERLWPLPLWDAYKKDIESDVADVRNFSGRPVAGAISAGKFLEFFTNNHECWAHLDIAGVAFGETEFGNQRAATGFGIHLLTTFIESEI